MAEAEEEAEYGGVATDSMTQTCFLLRRCAPLEGEAAAAEAASRGATAPHAMLTRHGHGGFGFGAAPPSAQAGPSPAPGGGGGVALDGLPLSDAGAGVSMPRGVRGEPAECGQARYAAFVRCAGATDGNAASVLSDANATPFAKLHRFVLDAAAEGGAAGAPAGAGAAFGVFGSGGGQGGAAPTPPPWPCRVSIACGAGAPRNAASAAAASPSSGAQRRSRKHDCVRLSVATPP